jgi:hypothetical protein
MRTENGVSTRKSVALPDGVNKRLTAYAPAAGAAGVGVLALAQPAEADIIVKSANIVINSSHPNETLTIVGSHRLNFHFYIPPFGMPSTAISVAGEGASVLCTIPGPFVIHLYAGGPIGPPAGSSPFIPFGLFFFGSWGSRPGYMGFDFANRFGWAKMTFNPFRTSALLTEFAYNTVPGQAIFAGLTTVPEPGTAALALLALGALGLSALRGRKRSAVSSQPPANA